MPCTDCNCDGTPVIDPNIRRAIAALVVAQTALEKAYEASECADHDFALEFVMGEIGGLGAMLMENPDLSTLAEGIGWGG